MQKVLHETCEQYVARRLSEGWRIVSQVDFNVILQSPEGIIRPVDLRNDVETLRPNAAGDETGIDVQYPNSTSHYDKVDEVSADGDTTYVATSSGSLLIDYYNLPAHSVGSGIINFIKVYVNLKATTTPDRTSATIGVQTGGTTYFLSPILTVTNSYALYSNQWSTNPKTGNAWTWDDIDALQLVVALRDPILAGSTYETRCTQVYVEVDYTAVTVYDETGKLQVILAAQGETETVARQETGKEQVILAVQGETDIQAMVETGKEQTILGVLTAVDIQAMVETGKEQIILAAQGEADGWLYVETGKEQTILAVLGETDIQAMVETGKLQIVLVVPGEADVQTMQELGITQIVLVVAGEVEAATYPELGRLQEILTLIDETDIQAMAEAREQIIKVILESADIQAMVESLEQLILAVVGKEEGRLLTSRRTTGKARVLDAIREESPERVLESKEVPH